MELWNTRNLKIPSLTTYKGTIPEQDLLSLRSLLRETLEGLKARHLDAEAALVSRLIYRMKSKFRSDKGFRNFEKVNRALLIYLEADLSKSLRLFMEQLPRRYESELYLPSKNLIDFVLVRVQGVAVLLKRVRDTCKACAYFMQDKIAIGQFWKLGFICFGAVSRIYKLVTELIRCLCGLYSKLLHDFAPTFVNKGARWLPESYSFPADLKDFLQIDFTEDTNVPQLFPKQTIDNIVDLQMVSKDRQESVNTPKISLDNDNFISPQVEMEDIGQIVNYQSTNENNLPGSNLKKKKSIVKYAKSLSIPHSTIDILKGIKNLVSLQVFVKRERKLRNRKLSGQGALTDLDKIQFKKVNNAIKETVNKCLDGHVSEQMVNTYLHQLQRSICRVVATAQETPNKNEEESNEPLSKESMNGPGRKKKIKQEKSETPSNQKLTKLERVLNGIKTVDDLKSFLKLHNNCSTKGVLENMDASQYKAMKSKILKCIRKCQGVDVGDSKIDVYLNVAKDFIRKNIPT